MNINKNSDQISGMEIQRDRMAKTVRVTQTTYLKKVLARFGMTSCASAPTPMVVGSQLQAEVIDKVTPQAVHEYQSMIGSIMYPMIQTRPDIGQGYRFESTDPDVDGGG